VKIAAVDAEERPVFGIIDHGFVIAAALGRRE
jgi:hypothetical protein